MEAKEPVFTQGWLVLGAVLLAVGLGVRAGGVVLVGAVLLLGAAVSYVSHRTCLAGVEVRRVLAPRRAFPGEQVVVTLEVTNRKVLPLAWLEVTDELPEEVVPQRGRVVPSVRQRRQHLVHLFTLRWYQRVRRPIPLHCTARGYFPLGPVRVRSGDLFGTTWRAADLPRVDHLVVYPRVVPLTALGLPARHPLGDAAMRRPLLEDPARTVGVRAYQTTDPYRRIHWKATARLGRLQSRQYEATASHRVVLFLNLDTLGAYAEYRGFVRPLLELAIMVAASVAAWATTAGYPVGLIANGYVREAVRRVRIAPALGTGHLRTMLDALARILPSPMMPLGELMSLESGALPWGSTAVVVTAVVDPTLAMGVRRLRAAGHAVTVILIGDQVEDPGWDVPTWRVRGEANWHAMATIRLA